MTRNPLARAGLSLVTVAFLASAASSQTLTFSNTNPITIPTSGTSSLFPSTIDVSGFTGVGTVTDITVQIFGFSHSFPEDIGVLVTGPVAGQKTILFNGAGGPTEVTNANLTFNDSAAATLQTNVPIVTGTYRPGHNDYPDDPLSAPAPGVDYSTAFGPTPAPGISGTFIGASNPNGVYSLFVEDFVGGDGGSIAGGWAVTITFTPVPEPASVLFGAAGLGLVGTAIRRRRNAKRA